MFEDRQLVLLLGIVLGLLLLATLIGRIMQARLTHEAGQALAENILTRTKAWWVMCAVFAVAILSGGMGSILLFAMVSFLALREFVTILPTRRGDHRALFWVFFIIVPLQYLLVGVGWYGLFSIFIPVFCFLFLPMRMVAAGEVDDFLGRVAKEQWGLMACVYCVSHAPAILQLPVEGDGLMGAKLMFFFVMMVELGDVAQYVWGKSFGKRKVAPTVSPNKTWAGVVGGVLTVAVVGAAMSWCTPFSPGEAAAMAAMSSFLGFFGDLTMSAIKRDADIKDFGQLLQGHGGILDRIDSLCFAAPVFFHLTRYFHGTGELTFF